MNSCSHQSSKGIKLHMGLIIIARRLAPPWVPAFFSFFMSYIFFMKVMVCSISSSSSYCGEDTSGSHHSSIFYWSFVKQMSRKECETNGGGKGPATGNISGCRALSQRNVLKPGFFLLANEQGFDIDRAVSLDM